MSNSPKEKMPILCLDFDGVIHSYESGWQGPEVIPDPPVPGALEFIREATQAFQVAIYSSRSGQPLGIEAMQFWLRLQFYKVEEREVADPIMDKITWPTEKPPAMVTIDDRALCFSGNWKDYDIDRLLSFQPWNKFPSLRQPASVEAEPVGWAYDWPGQERGHAFSAERWGEGDREGWTETPLYAHPSADVTALLGDVRRWYGRCESETGCDYLNGEAGHGDAWDDMKAICSRIDAHLADQVQS